MLRTHLRAASQIANSFRVHEFDLEPTGTHLFDVLRSSVTFPCWVDGRIASLRFGFLWAGPHIGAFHFLDAVAHVLVVGAHSVFVQLEPGGVTGPWLGTMASHITRRVVNSKSNSAAGAISVQFGACIQVAWTPVFSKFLKIQPFVWNRTARPG